MGKNTDSIHRLGTPRMRSAVFLTLGILEVLVAVVLVGFAWKLPGAPEVDATVGRVERVSRQSAVQVVRLRQHVEHVRARRPQMQEMAVRLQSQMRSVVDELRRQRVDYPTVQTVHDALGEVAEGLDGMSSTLDPKGLGQAGAGLKGAADFLDNRLATAAVQAADRLDASTEALRTDAGRLASLLRQAPPDLKAAREIYDGLGRFTEGLGKLESTLKLQRLEAMREGFKGLQESLETGAGQVGMLSSYSYPVVTFNGLRPSVEQRPFWPEGGTIAAGMRKAAKGSSAAVEEMDAVAQDLPRLVGSLEESRKVAERTREAIGTALKQQEKLEPLLTDIPAHAARLTEELPQLGGDLSRILRDTAKLKDLAGVLREAQKGVDLAVVRWPGLRKNLGRSADLLRATQAQMRRALEHRQEFEASLQQSVTLARSFASALPLLTDQLESELLDQERSLGELQSSIEEVAAAAPACGETATGILRTSRLLLGLVGFIFALHGTYLVAAGKLGRRFSL